MTASHPAELRRTATVARHHNMPLVAAALDAAAERIEGLLVALHDAIRRPMGVVPASAEPYYDAAMAEGAREALREVGR